MSTLDDNVFSSEQKVSEVAIRELSATVPWMKITSVIGMILSAVYLFLGITLSFYRANFFSVYSIIFSIISIIFGFAYFFLLQYAIQVGNYAHNPDPHVLETAFEKQKTFWIVVTVITILLSIIMLITAFGMLTTFRKIQEFSY